MKIIHISDIHLTLRGEEMGGLDPHKRFARALDSILANHSDAARIIITGDLTHWGERGAYEALKDAVQDLPIPLRLLIGNHDDRATFLEVFPDHPVDAAGFVNHAETLDGVRFIYLDSVGERTHAGHFCETRRAWLDAELQACSRARIFLHHNPMTLGLPAEDKIALVASDRPAFRALLERHADKIEHLHFGHVHAPISGTVAGIPFASVPSTGNQSYPDLKEADWLQGGPMEPGYFVLLAEGGDTILHLIPFDWDGPIHKSGTEWADWAKPAPAPEPA